MTPDPDLATQSTVVLWAAFALAFAFGAIVQRTNFCTMGSVADVVSFGDWTRMRQWLLAIAVAIAGTTLLDAAGLIDVRRSFYTSDRFTPLAYIGGGLLFGFGMVLAGGCGSKSLVRAGAGNLKSVVVLIVLGVVAYITLRGGLALFRVGVLERVGFTLASRQDLPSMLADTAAARGAWQVGLGLPLAGAIAWIALRDRAFWTFDNLLAGIGIGGIIVAVWYVSGHIGYVEEHPQTLEQAFLRTNSRQMESLSFVAPGRLDTRLPDVRQRQKQGTDDRHRRGDRHGRGLLGLRHRNGPLSLGRISQHRRHCEPSRWWRTDGLRRSDRRRLHDRTGAFGSLDTGSGFVCGACRHRRGRDPGRSLPGLAHRSHGRLSVIRLHAVPEPLTCAARRSAPCLTPNLPLRAAQR